MLEDNLDGDSYKNLRALLAAHLPSDVVFVRNACPGCFEGNDSGSYGDSTEVHSPDFIDQVGTSDGLVLDGDGILYPGDDASKGGYTVDQLNAILDKSLSLAQGYFGLWRAQRQGLGDQLTHPDNRYYEVPSSDQVDQEIALLRHGLQADTSATSEDDQTKAAAN